MVDAMVTDGPQPITSRQQHACAVPRAKGSPEPHLDFQSGPARGRRPIELHDHVLVRSGLPHLYNPASEARGRSGVDDEAESLLADQEDRSALYVCCAGQGERAQT